MPNGGIPPDATQKIPEIVYWDDYEPIALNESLYFCCESEEKDKVPLCQLLKFICGEKAPFAKTTAAPSPPDNSCSISGIKFSWSLIPKVGLTSTSERPKFYACDGSLILDKSLWKGILGENGKNNPTTSIQNALRANQHHCEPKGDKNQHLNADEYYTTKTQEKPTIQQAYCHMISLQLCTSGFIPKEKLESLQQELKDQPMSSRKIGKKDVYSFDQETQNTELSKYGINNFGGNLFCGSQKCNEFQSIIEKAIIEYFKVLQCLKVAQQKDIAIAVTPTQQNGILSNVEYRIMNSSGQQLFILFDGQMPQLAGQTSRVLFLVVLQHLLPDLFSTGDIWSMLTIKSIKEGKENTRKFLGEPTHEPG